MFVNRFCVYATMTCNIQGPATSKATTRMSNFGMKLKISSMASGSNGHNGNSNGTMS